MRKAHPELRSVPVGALARNLKELHNKFRAHRKGPPIPVSEFQERYGTMGHAGNYGRPLAVREDHPGDSIGRTYQAGREVLHHAEGHYIPEGFTAEQLTDPATVEYLMGRIKADRPVPAVPLTTPAQMVLRQWVGARTYIESCAAVYGETPREGDRFKPLPGMMMAQVVLEPILRAHPLVLEPEQMNAIDAEDWSFAEAADYALMAHLQFEPLYLDFGGHEPVLVELEAGPCRLFGAVIWRSGYFSTPTLAVAPIGGFDYLTGPLAEKLLAEGIAPDVVKEYVGVRPGTDVRVGTPTIRASGHINRLSHRELAQWVYQTAGICWFGVGDTQDYPDERTEKGSPYARIPTTFGERQVVDLTFSGGSAIREALREPALYERTDPTRAVVLTGMFSDPDEGPDFKRMMRAATEMVARLAERALLGLYFIENAPIRIEEVSLARPERREMERKARKGRDPGEIASIVVIKGSRAQATSNGHGGREYSHRFERRGHFRHLHENNRHYQLRPDLVKPCHKCEREYAANEQARREGRELPYPNCESPDCIKQWIEPIVIGPVDKPLVKKVRIRRADTHDESEAA